VHEGVRVDDGAVDVALGGEVDDDLVAGEVRFDGFLVADVALDEGAALVVEDVAQVLEVSGVGELVVDGDLVVAVGEQPGT